MRLRWASLLGMGCLALDVLLISIEPRLVRCPNDCLSSCDFSFGALAADNKLGISYQSTQCVLPSKEPWCRTGLVVARTCLLFACSLRFVFAALPVRWTGHYYIVSSQMEHCSKIHTQLRFSYIPVLFLKHRTEIMGVRRYRLNSVFTVQTLRKSHSYIALKSFGKEPCW